jgi:hypothetical protein
MQLESGCICVHANSVPSPSLRGSSKWQDINLSYVPNKTQYSTEDSTELYTIDSLRSPPLKLHRPITHTNLHRLHNPSPCRRRDLRHPVPTTIVFRLGPPQPPRPIRRGKTPQLRIRRREVIRVGDAVLVDVYRQHGLHERGDEADDADREVEFGGYAGEGAVKCGLS